VYTYQEVWEVYLVLEEKFKQGSLVLYKEKPALVKRAGEKLEIALRVGKRIRVRTKDVALLHPGPVFGFNELEPPEGDIQTAWELLLNAGEDDQSCDLVEVAELIYGEFTPASAWATWELVHENLYFTGTPDAVSVRSQREVAGQIAAREAKEAAALAWKEFMQRIADGTYALQDERYLREVEELAYGSRQDSRVMRDLGRTEHPETAHALLLELGYWDNTIDPYPRRFGLPTASPALDLPDLQDESREDLTHLQAFAIDDRDNVDPDDAISLEGNRLWVHVADVAALVSVDSPLDMEARSRGANLYLPDRTVHMLPAEVSTRMGLGLSDRSPALSFGIDMDPDARITNLEIVPSWVSVQRLTYEQVEERMDEEPFEALGRITQAYRDRRRENGALFIDLPEVILRVGADGKVSVRRVFRLRSRNLVQEAMLMAGEASARYAMQFELPFPYAAQESAGDAVPSEAVLEQPLAFGDLARAFAARNVQKSARVGGIPAPHAGIGLAAYARVTSPMRRYLDLVAHQQLRAHLRGDQTLGEGELLERVGASEAVSRLVRGAERRSRLHWTLVYLLQNPEWCGPAVLVKKFGSRGKFILPDLGLEIQIHLRQDPALNSVVEMVVKEVILAELEAYFEIHEL